MEFWSPTTMPTGWRQVFLKKAPLHNLGLLPCSLTGSLARCGSNYLNLNQA
jgi:hypothetical protein